ncbi:TIGR02300 family protein [Kordiimonas lipolytica]|uniref:TIGR02300 family protein n=1 Tax=Kordiimonas lipolytica TaxID=1662421 RepID=A0ABV8U7Y4_9PROT|nr:TIGR02300 family protein [Kordiimonas lipolytica]
MVKPEWGTKRTCPKCGTRFYDLTKDDPVVCIDCGNEWTPEPILKTKQPLPVAEEKEKEPEANDDDDDLDVDDDDLSDVSLDDDDDDEVSSMVDTSLADDDS